MIKPQLARLALRGNNMIEALILIDGKGVSEESLRSVSLGNALQLVIGSTPGFGIVLHIAADSPAYLGTALLDFARVPGVTKVLTLAIRNEK
jgi:hypothetical protein